MKTAEGHGKQGQDGVTTRRGVLAEPPMPTVEELNESIWPTRNESGPAGTMSLCMTTPSQLSLQPSEMPE
jgi:hypothetical protein